MCSLLLSPSLSYTGGILLIAIDLRGLREYFKLNPLPGNFDSIFQLLVESDIFTEKPQRDATWKSL